MTQIAHIILLVAGLLDLFVMLRLDMLTLQECGFDNREYNKRLKDSSEFTSPKRLLAPAVLLGLCTDMAQMSWIVVFILAAVLLAQGITLLVSNRGKRPLLPGRAKSIHITACVLATLILCTAAGCCAAMGIDKTDMCRYIAMLALLFTAGSPLLTMATNWLFKAKK